MVFPLTILRGTSGDSPRRSITSCVEKCGALPSSTWTPLDSSLKDDKPRRRKAPHGRKTAFRGDRDHIFRYSVSVDRDGRLSHGRARRNMTAQLNDVTHSATSPLRFESHAAPKLRAVVHHAIRHHELHRANIVNRFQRIRAKDHYVSPLFPLQSCPLPCPRPSPAAGTIVAD